jgi:cell wall-associated NlpC family hydrolase
MLRRALLVLVIAGLPLTAAPLAAGAAPAPPAGRLSSVRLDTFTHRLAVSGWAYDPARSSASITVAVYVDGRYAGSAPADRPSTKLDQIRRISGRHAFTFARAWTGAARTVTITARPAGGGAAATLHRAAVTRVMPPAGTRIVTVAKRYVGKARYVEGGASPRGFDCSGYTRYAYQQAKVRTLPHNTELQRHLRGMRKISRSSARPGDLVFYLSGGRSYHVAIYAGRGMQYAAATPRDGIRYQKVWSRQVEYRTILH